MAHPVDQLMNILYPEQSPDEIAAWKYSRILETLDTYLVENNISIEKLPALLIFWGKEPPKILIEYDQRALRDILSLLQLIIQDDASVSYLLRHLKSLKTASTCIILGWMGQRAKLAIVDLLWVVADSQFGARDAIRALRRIGLEKDLLLSYMRQLLERDVPLYDAFCGEVFSNIGFLVNDLGYDDDPEFAAILLQAARHSNPLYRKAALDIVSERITGIYVKHYPIIELLRADVDKDISGTAQKIANFICSDEK